MLIKAFHGHNLAVWGIEETNRKRICLMDVYSERTCVVACPMSGYASEDVCVCVRGCECGCENVLNESLR